MRTSSRPASARYSRPAALIRGARRKPSVAGVDARRVDLRDLHERAQPGLRRAGERLQPRAHEAAVLALERDDVGDGGERDEVEVLVGLGGIAPRGGEQRAGELVRDAGRAQLRARVAAERRVHDRRVGQRAVGARRVVVGDHDVHARARAAAATSSTAVIAQSAVTSSLVPFAASRSTVCGVQPVAVLEAARQVEVDRGAEPAQHADEDRRRADAVDVVVAVDGDRRRRPRRGAGSASTAVVDAVEQRDVVRLVARASHARAASGSASPRRTSTCATGWLRRRARARAAARRRRGAGSTSSRATGFGGGRDRGRLGRLGLDRRRRRRARRSGGRCSTSGAAKSGERSTGHERPETRPRTGRTRTLVPARCGKRASVASGA